MIGASMTQSGGTGMDQFYATINPASVTQDWQNNGTTSFIFGVSVYNTSGSLTYQWTSSNPRIVIKDPDDFSTVMTVSGSNEVVSGTASCLVTDTTLMESTTVSALVSIEFS